ncbi:MAG: hypothetical protein JO157_13375, partial [Acetobacteraceae bacterium]|nr:hypothetical protein [Acetobacteraceae bacterium]
ETPLPVADRPPTRVDSDVYRRQVAAAFHGLEHEWGEEIGIAAELDAIKAIGDGFLTQGHYANALSVYDAILDELLEQYEEYEDEGGELAGVVVACVEALGSCLAGERDATAREAILHHLFSVYRTDVGLGGVGLSDAVPDLILSHATADERRLVAGWARQALPPGGSWSADFARQAYGGFLLALEGDALDDAAYLRICRETGRLHDLVERLLVLGRVEDALDEAGRAADFPLLDLADLLTRRGEGDAAERLVRERATTSQDRRLLVWLKERYRARNDLAAALEMTLELFRSMPDLAQYRDIRALAQDLDRWESLRPQLLAQLRDSRHTNLLIDVYLEDDEVDRALELLSAAPSTAAGSPVHQYAGAIELKVAAAAEGPHPSAAREIYQRSAERLIDARGRENYQAASRLLAKVRDLSARLGEQEGWAHYLRELRGQYRALPALKDELARAGL